MDEEGAEGGNWDGLSLEVLEMIFCHLPVTDLLSCSVMSKNWKTAARYVLKRSRECYTHIKDFHHDIQDLNAMIASTSLMEMVNGLHISNEIKPTNQLASASSSLEQAFRCTVVQNTLHSGNRPLKKGNLKVDEVLGIQWRYLNLDLGLSRGLALSPDDASLLREVIHATSGSLEKLVIGREEDWPYIPCYGNEYSKLKVIQLVNDQYQRHILTEIFSPAFAPELEKITGAMMMLEVNKPAHRFWMERMKSIMLCSDLEVPEDESKETFGCISGLRRLDLQHNHCDPDEDDPDQQPQDLESWNAFVFPFVLRSLDTLEELDMYTFDMYNLFKTSHALEFPNLRRLSLATHLSAVIKNEISALKELNLAKLCPNLEQVELSAENSSAGVETEMMMRPLEACGGLLEQSSLPVKIVLDCSVGNLGMHLNEYLTFFSSIYPNLVQLKILSFSDVFFFGMGSVIWDISSLEYLEIHIYRLLIWREVFPWGLDALLCGINIEEAELLFEGRGKKSAQQNAIFVPIRSSLFNAKSLKELKITEENSGGGKIMKLSWVAQITENLPGRQVRNLKVTFEGSEGFYNDLKQLTAFSSIICAQVSEI